MSQYIHFYSEEAMLASRSFITSVVVGKDIVPSIGLNQLETLRLQLMDEIKNSKQSKVKQFSFRLEYFFFFLQWKTIANSFSCCSNISNLEDNLDLMLRSPSITMQLLDGAVNLSTHQPLYPPGKIIHIVRQHPGKSRKDS